MDRQSYLKQKKQERKSTHKRVELQLSVREYQRFERAAKKEGVSVNQLITNMAVAYRDSRYFIPHEIKTALDTTSRLIRNIANNINQIAHRANLFEDVDEKLVFDHLAKLDQDIKQFVEGKLQ